jgi:hypothetical protein
MARVQTLKANKDYPNEGIKRGDTYYKWSLRFSRYGKGTTYRSKTYPKASQLTSSAFMQSVYQAQEQLAGIGLSENLDDSPDDIKSEIESVISDLESLRDETDEKFNNMPEGLQQGDTGQLLEERVENLDSWISDLQALEVPERDDGQSDEDFKQALEDFLEEISNTMGEF